MYDKSILAKSTGASLGVVAIVGMLFLSTGTAFALPISGIGGFTISATEIEGENLKLYPAGAQDRPNDASNASQYPQGVVELTDTTITDLRLTKEFDLGEFTGFPDSAGNARLVITAGNNGTKVSTNNILLKTPKLGAQSATFNGLTINEQNSNNIRETFTITASTDPSAAPNEYGATRQSLDLNANSGPGLILEQPNIRATYLTTSQITLPDLALEIQWDTNDNGQYTDRVDYGSASS
ncbi:DUF6230 family protein [Halorientalis marina]|uniref:DUF6230 family protein n=1 Tax=Halorientalis marina TaxID=2931976 RepID=UPI001FF134AC|nr:DUF6230 family protein [Halorientalis marina]